MVHYLPKKQIISLTLNEDGTLSVVERTPSQLHYCGGGTVPDEVVKKTYAAEQGRIVLHEVIQGKHIPARNIPESFTFEE